MLYQSTEKDDNGENCTKNKVQADKFVISFPHEQFHLGSAIYRYVYYSKFLLKYSKRYYANLLKEKFGIETPARPYGYKYLTSDAWGYYLDVEMSQMFLIGYEDNIARSLANKYELGKLYSKYFGKVKNQAGLTRIILDRLKEKSKENNGYCTTHMTDARFQLKMPAKYKHFENAYELIKQLDEYKEQPPIEIYRWISYQDYVLDAKTAEILIRNYEKPIVYTNNFHARYMMIQTYFFPSVFFLMFTKYPKKENINLMSPKREFMFKSIVIEKQFIDIPKKIYYIAELWTSKADINLQGINTLSEILSIYKKYAKIQYTDMENEQNEEYNYKWFNAVVGLPYYRYLMHGRYDVQLKNLVIHLYPDMYYPSEKPHLIIGISKFDLQQYYHEVNIIIKNLLIEKDKLNPNETALLCIPQIESHAAIIFNNPLGLDHFLHYNARTLEELNTRIEHFTNKNFDVSLKFNLASFYTPDNIPHALSDTVEDIIAKALSPYVHYQFSYLSLIIQTIDAFTVMKIPMTPLDKASRRQSLIQRESTVTAPEFSYCQHYHFFAFFNDF